MKVLITGANGYIGARLLPVLLDKGHELICLVRDKRRFMQNSDAGRVQIITGDLLKEISIPPVPPDIDAAYYLVNGPAGMPEFSHMEALSAHHFVRSLNLTNCKQLIYLSDIENDDQISQQTTSHRVVEAILQEANAALTTLRTSVIIGSGSPAFEIIRDVAEKSSIIIAPASVKNKCQPIAAIDVLSYLESVLFNRKTFNQSFDIGGPDILSFKELVLAYAKMRNIKCRMIVLPFSSLQLAAYWLRLASTAGSQQNIQSFVQSMNYEKIMKDHRIDNVVQHICLTCEQALTLASAPG